MDAAGLKKDFGGKIVFRGGGADTQGVLHFGTPEEVREHVKYHIQTLGKDGGYVFSSNHNVRPDAPVENIMAMIEAAKEFRNYA